jgi:hypothetical protein
MFARMWTAIPLHLLWSAVERAHDENSGHYALPRLGAQAMQNHFARSG